MADAIIRVAIRDLRVVMLLLLFFARGKLSIFFLFLQGSEKPDFPYWVAKFANLSHLMITFSCSSNFYIYFVKYGGRKALNKRQLVFKFKFMSPSETSPPQLSCFNNSLPPSSVASQTQPSASALRLTRSPSISPSPTYSPRANRHRRHKSRTSSYVNQR